MTEFGAYARYYDLLYHDKDYEAEADFIHALVHEFAPQASSLLDLGCGTGRHALSLAKKGYAVTGVDRSDEMLASAHARLAKSVDIGGGTADFVAGDIRNMGLGLTFDVTTALFHVMSYQTANADLAGAFKTVRAHTRTGGVFIFDCWFGPGVLSDPPQVRVKRYMESDSVEIVRISEPQLRPLENLVDVAYTLIVSDRAFNRTEQIRETHTMRYLFKPEIEMLAQANGFEIVECCQWLVRLPPDGSSWNACFIARAH